MTTFWWRACCKDGPDMISLWQNPIPFVLSTPILRILRSQTCVFIALLNDVSFGLWFLVWRYLLYNVRLPKTNPPDENPWVCMQVIKKTYKNRPSWAGLSHSQLRSLCVWSHGEIHQLQCPEKRNPVGLPQFSPWFFCLDWPVGKQESSAGRSWKNTFKCAMVKTNCRLKCNLYYTSYKLYIYVHGVPLFCDFRSTHFYRSLPQPAPVSKTPNTLASRKWPPWMIQPWGCLRRRDFFWDLNGTMWAPPVMFVV